jgi:hypothetical protein
MKWTDIATFLITHVVAVGAYLFVFFAIPSFFGGIAVIVLLIGGIITREMCKEICSRWEKAGLIQDDDIDNTGEHESRCDFKKAARLDDDLPF